MTERPVTIADWAHLYTLCRKRAYGELGLPIGDAEMWANAEADRLAFGLDYGSPEERP